MDVNSYRMDDSDVHQRGNVIQRMGQILCCCFTCLQRDDPPPHNYRNVEPQTIANKKREDVETGSQMGNKREQK